LEENDTNTFGYYFDGKKLQAGRITSANIMNKKGNVVGVSNKLHISNKDAYTPNALRFKLGEVFSSFEKNPNLA